jgi:hypothetical protein
MTPTITPNAINHANLIELQSRFLAIDHLPWASSQVEGVESKTLVFEKSSGLLTILMRIAPDVTFPDHSHMQIE